MLSTSPKLHIQLSHLVDNYHFLKKKCAAAYPAAVVKDNAYGLGAQAVAKRLAREGCRRFFVAHACEGERIRQVLPAADIYVLQGIGVDSAPLFQKNRLIPVLSSLEQISLWDQLGISDVRPIIQIETGLNRLGLRPADWAQLTPQQLSCFSFMLSHLACADDPYFPLNKSQLERFEQARSFLKLPATLSASDGLFLGQNYHYDMVRVGAALYGLNTSPNSENPMKAVLYVQAPILQIAELETGETVGYGASFKALKPTRMAVVSIGYGDGLPRALSNRGSVRYKGATCPIIGRISMDNIMCDISGVQNALSGDFIDVLDDDYTADHMAKDAGTIGYEIISNFGKGDRFCRTYAE